MPLTTTHKLRGLAIDIIEFIGIGVYKAVYYCYCLFMKIGCVLVDYLDKKQ